MTRAAVSTLVESAPLGARPIVDELLERRTAASGAFFASNAERIAELCAQMADRFSRGGRLIALGLSPSARSDARHVAVEFVHPVIVGKRALPAFALTAGPERLAAELRVIASPSDMVIAFASASDETALPIARAIGVARARDCLTIALDQIGAEVEFLAPTNDPFVWQEISETLYHVLWELVHVFFEHGAERASAASDPGSSAFLYPFLAAASRDLSAVKRDVARSVVAKAAETDTLRGHTIGAAAVAVAAGALRSRIDRGGTLFAFGNGGSATDAMDFVADLRTPPWALELEPRRAVDLTDDPSILTALANDVGLDLVFTRQLIAYARAGDVAIAFSTSGSSRNIIAALDEARRRGMVTVAFTGYDGGLIAAKHLVDFVFVAPSQHIPRIQEAHATAYHVLRTLIG